MQNFQRKSNPVAIKGLQYENRLFIQSMITFLIFVIDDCCWTFHPLVFPNSHWAPIISNLIWILELGLNPFFYFVFNKLVFINYIQSKIYYFQNNPQTIYFRFKMRTSQNNPCKGSDDFHTFKAF